MGSLGRSPVHWKAVVRKPADTVDWKKGFVDQVDFKSAVEDWQSDVWWDCDKVMCARWGESGGEWKGWSRQEDDSRDKDNNRWTLWLLRVDSIKINLTNSIHPNQPIRVEVAFYMSCYFTCRVKQQTAYWSLPISALSMLSSSPYVVLIFRVISALWVILCMQAFCCFIVSHTITLYLMLQSMAIMSTLSCLNAASLPEYSLHELCTWQAVILAR